MRARRGLSKPLKAIETFSTFAPLNTIGEPLTPLTLRSWTIIKKREYCNPQLTSQYQTTPAIQPAKQSNLQAIATFQANPPS